MKLTNIKNIVIWMLIIVNGIFLSYFLWGVIGNRTEEKEVHESIRSILEQNGISIDPADIHELDVLNVLETSRDKVQEQSIAQALLGETNVAEQGGNIQLYEGENGQAVFHSGGEFLITIFPKVYPLSSSAERTVKAILKEMQLEARVTTVTGESGNETVMAVSTWRNRTIFSCRIAFVFQGGSLVEISGNLASMIKVTQDEVDMSSCATALMRLLSEIKSGQYACAVILYVEPGYLLESVSQYGDGSLKPVWRIVTDAGTYYVDAVTGKVDVGA